MKRLVIQARKFSVILDQLIEEHKLTKEDYQNFEEVLVKDPEEGEVIQGTGGLRKTRMKSASKGKRGGFRVCYCDIPEKEQLFLMVLYPKNVKEDLSQDDKKVLKALIQKLREE